MDGNDVRGASKQTANGRRMLVAAAEQVKVLGQLEVDSKTNEIPAVRELALRLDLVGFVVAYDALHAMRATTTGSSAVRAAINRRQEPQTTTRDCV